MMSGVSPAIKLLSLRIIAREKSALGLKSENSDALIRASEKLRLPLIKFAGVTGFSSLLSRALTLAKRQTPALSALVVAEDGTLSNVQPLASMADAADAGATILAELLGLLATLIGEPFMLDLVREVWPGISAEVDESTD